MRNTKVKMGIIIAIIVILVAIIVISLLPKRKVKLSGKESLQDFLQKETQFTSKTIYLGEITEEYKAQSMNYVNITKNGVLYQYEKKENAADQDKGNLLFTKSLSGEEVTAFLDQIQVLMEVSNTDKYAPNQTYHTFRRVQYRGITKTVYEADFQAILASYQ